MLKHSYLPPDMLDSVIIPRTSVGAFQINITINPLQSLVLYQKSLKTLSYTGLKIIYGLLITSLLNWVQSTLFH